MPNTCTVAKIVVRIVDSNLKDVRKVVTRVAEFDSQAIMPWFNCKIELRLPFFNPTLIAIIQLLTVDEKDEKAKPSIVGYGFYPFFLDRKTHRQPEIQSNQNYVLRNGKYQIPIFCQNYYDTKPFLYR